MDTSDKKYEEIVGKYVEAKKKENHYKNIVREMSDEIDKMMHEEKVNSKLVNIEALDELYECKYVDRKNRSVDYSILSEIVTDVIYNKVVTEKESTFLSIKPAKKEVKNREKPIIEKEVKSLNIPIGNIRFS